MQRVLCQSTIEGKIMANALIEAVISGNIYRVQTELNKTWYGAVGENGMTGLHYAAQYGYPEIGQLFIDKGLFVNRTNYDGQQSLHIAAMYHQDTMVDMLIENGAAIRAVDYLGNTPLHYSIQNNPTSEFVQKMIDLGSDLNGKNLAGNSPLQTSVNESNSEIYTLLLSNGAQPENLTNLLQAVVDGNIDDVSSLLNRTWPGATGPLGLTGVHYSTIFNQPEIAQLFLDKGVFVNTTTHDGKQSLHLASMLQSSSMVDFLMEHGAAILAVDYLGNTPLHYAVQNNPSLDFVQKIIDHGSNLNSKNKAGETALNLIEDQGNHELIALLLSHGAVSETFSSLITAVIIGDIDGVEAALDNSWVGSTGPNGMTGLHYAALYGYPEIGQLFVDKGLFVNRTNYSGEQSLHIAAMAHQGEMVDMLLANGAAILGVDYLGNTPLHYAVMNNPSTAFVQKIIDAGANLNSANNAGETPLDLVQAEGNHELFALLLSNGAVSEDLSDLIVAAIIGDEARVSAELEHSSAGTVGENGMTGLHYAALFGHAGVGQLFIDKGLFVNQTTYDGQQPLHIAAASHSDEVVDMLMDNGAAILAVDYLGNTPLHYAVQGNPDLSFVQKLINLGSNLDTVNKAGETALEFAKAEGNSDVVDLLIDNGAIINLVTATTFDFPEPPMSSKSGVLKLSSQDIFSDEAKELDLEQLGDRVINALESQMLPIGEALPVFTQTDLLPEAGIVELDWV